MRAGVTGRKPRPFFVLAWGVGMFVAVAGCGTVEEGQADGPPVSTVEVGAATADSSEDESVSSEETADTSPGSPGGDDLTEQADEERDPVDVSAAPDMEPSEVDDSTALTLVEPLIAGDSELLSDPVALDPSGLDALAADAALAQARASANEYATLGWRQVGSPEIDGIQVNDVDESSDPPRAVVDVCLDHEGVDVVDDSGESVVDPSAPTRVLTTFVLERRDGSWIVVDRTFPVDTDC